MWETQIVKIIFISYTLCSHVNFPCRIISKLSLIHLFLSAHSIPCLPTHMHTCMHTHLLACLNCLKSSMFYSMNQSTIHILCCYTLTQISHRHLHYFLHTTWTSYVTHFHCALQSISKSLMPWQSWEENAISYTHLEPHGDGIALDTVEDSKGLKPCGP